MTDTTASSGANMGLFERWLTLWIALAIVAGIVLGAHAPGLVGAIAAAEVASINLVVAVLIWAMWSATEIFTSRLPEEWAIKSAYLRVFLIGLLLQIVLQKFSGGIFAERRFKSAD